MMVRVNEADQDGAFLHGIDHVQCRRLNAEYQIGVGDQLRSILDEHDILERGVGQPDGVAGSGLHM